MHPSPVAQFQPLISYHGKFNLYAKQYELLQHFVRIEIVLFFNAENY